MQHRKDEISSSEASEDESTLDNLTAEELEAEGLCSLLSYSNERKRQDLCHYATLELISASMVRQTNSESMIEARDKYFAFLDQVRASAYYQALQEKFNKNEKLTANEYYYFAMVTDDVSKLNLTALQSMTKTHYIYNFEANLDVLRAARAWQDATSAEEKHEINKQLKEALERRGNIRRANCEMFLNLRGINLSGADLSMTAFDYTDLGNANISQAKLYGTGFHYTRLDHADLSNADCVRPDLKGRMEEGPNIRSSTAKNACFDHMIAPNLDWRDNDFTGSSFKNADIGYGNFSNTIFDYCDFTKGKLRFSGSYITNDCSMKFANLITGKLIDVDYSKVDLTGAKFMPFTSFSDAEALSAALNTINQDVMIKLRTQDTSAWYRTSQIHSFQMLMAGTILMHLGKLSLGPLEKSNIIDAVLSHDLFLPEKYIHQLAFHAERNIYSFFSSQTHEAYASDAVKMLEAGRDDLLGEDHMMRMN